MGLFTKTVVGIEATASGVRVVEIVNNRVSSVVSIGEALIPTEEQHHGVGLDVITTGAKLEEAILSAKPKKVVAKEAYLMVPEDKVFRKILEIPSSVKDSELFSVVRAEVASYLPSDIDNMEIDYQVLPRRSNQMAASLEKDSKEGGAKKKEEKVEKKSEGKEEKEEKSEEVKKAAPVQVPLYVSVVAVDKQVVQEVIALCAHSKLLPTAIDTRPAAIARAVVPPKVASVAIVIEWHGGEAMVAVVEKGMVWATGMTKAGQDVGAAAAAISDELEHAVKFFMNRTGSTVKIPNAYVVSASPDAEALRKALEKLLDETKVVEGSLLLPFPVADNARYAAALGAAMYPLYGTLV